MQIQCNLFAFPKLHSALKNIKATPCRGQPCLRLPSTQGTLSSLPLRGKSMVPRRTAEGRASTLFPWRWSPLVAGTRLPPERWRRWGEPWQGTLGRRKGRRSGTSGGDWGSCCRGATQQFLATGCQLSHHPTLTGLLKCLQT